MEKCGRQTAERDAAGKKKGYMSKVNFVTDTKMKSGL